MNTFALNNEVNGVEIYFGQKPEQGILDELKLGGWRWHHKKRCWYTKQSEASIGTAQRIVGGESLAEIEPEAPAAGGVQELKGVKLGEIFYMSWGYEQTNVNFYQVIGFKGKGTAILREICYSLVRDHGSMSGEALPLKDDFKDREKQIEKRILGDCGTFKMDHHYLYRWDGRPKYVSWYA